ncbi:MAG: hypothetical protein HY590_05835 [Candidatus Omnitrophica bacterium]|nr:hypothetical protein [Candidatus Omnitrophota bacterium]
MKLLVIFVSVVLLVLLVLERSEVLTTSTYTEREGIIQVEKTRLEWHPEKLSPYLKKLPQKAKKVLRLMLGIKSAPKEKKKAKVKGPAQQLILKNGAMLTGKVVEKNDKGILFQTEEGQIFFRSDEIASLK